MGCNALPPMTPATWGLLMRSTPPWRWVDSGHKINSEKGKLRVEKPERTAVIGRNSVAGDGVAVGFRGIALVDIPSILRILSGYAAHIFVTMGLGKDRSRSYAHHFSVAFHYARVRYSGIRLETVAVDKQEIRFH